MRQPRLFRNLFLLLLLGSPLHAWSADRIESTVRLWVPEDAYVIADGLALSSTGERRNYKGYIESRKTREFNFDVYYIDERGGVQALKQKITLRAGETRDLIFDESEFKPYTSKATTAQLTLELPSDARVYIDRNETFSSGLTRYFTIPDITPGRTRELNVEVLKAGSTKKDQRTIVVISGTKARIKFYEESR